MPGYPVGLGDQAGAVWALIGVDLGHPVDHPGPAPNFNNAEGPLQQQFAGDFAGAVIGIGFSNARRLDAAIRCNEIEAIRLRSFAQPDGSH